MKTRKHSDLSARVKYRIDKAIESVSPYATMETRPILKDIITVVNDHLETMGKILETNYQSGYSRAFRDLLEKRILEKGQVLHAFKKGLLSAEDAQRILKLRPSQWARTLGCLDLNPKQ